MSVLRAAFAGSISIALLAISSQLSALSDAQPDTTTLALVGGRVFVAPDVPVINDGVVVVTEGRIARVGPRSTTAVPAGAATIDCRGLFVTAAFQNSHVHFTEEKWADAAMQPAPKLAEQLQAMLTRYGVTTVVDTASLLPNTAELRRRIEAGEIAGPRILTAGLALYPPNGVPYYVRDTVPPDLLKLLPQPTTARQATDAVRASFDGGADLVKLFTGSWVARGQVKPMPLAVASAAAAEAHRRGKLVFAHASNLAGLESALAARVDVLAHALDDDRGWNETHVARMRAINMAMIPTLKLFGGQEFTKFIQAEVGTYAKSGGQILFGTDVGFLTDYDTTDGYRLMAGAGLDWRAILASLTTAPAQRFGESARRGRIAPGLDADLVVLGADPALDVTAFADVRYTLRGGRIVYTAPARAEGRRRLALRLEGGPLR
jgi:imidazolonepropionase-like amidohydrolase